MTVYLAADVGGTKTDLVIYERERGLTTPLAAATLASADYASFSLLLRDFLGAKGLRIDRACFGVAGPVLDNRAQLTNLPWAVDGAVLSEEFAIPKVEVINDLVALGHAVSRLGDDDLLWLHRGRPNPQGAIAVVAPGTGLGMAFLVPDGSGYRVCPSEGGHAAFASAGEDVDMLRFLVAREETVSCEFLCSGPGLPRIYRYLRDAGLFPEPQWLAAEFTAAPDPARLIVEAALDGQRVCHICRETLRTFAGILADICGNFAVTLLATGGIYIGGGIPPRILPFLKDDAFPRRLRRRGKMVELLSEIPVAIITTPKAALLGAAACAERK